VRGYRRSEQHERGGGTPIVDRPGWTALIDGVKNGDLGLGTRRHRTFHGRQTGGGRQIGMPARVDSSRRYSTDRRASAPFSTEQD
jgi:hypothetical protein